MAKHTEIKSQNRVRIKKAAALIIQKEGIDKLSMRRLAKVANVSLRTPYNLFGSKTDVLISLLDEAQEGLIGKFDLSHNGFELERLFYGLDHVENLFSSNEEYFRDVYWGIMSSDQSAGRFNAFEQVIALCRSILANATSNGEIQNNEDTRGLSKHLATQLFATLGMWGSGFFNSIEATQHIRRSWCAALLVHSTKKSKPILLQNYKG